MIEIESNRGLLIEAFKKLRPDATNIIYDYGTGEINCQNVQTYPTTEELETSITNLHNEMIANANSATKPYDLIYKNMWDGDYSKTDDWQVLKEFEIKPGVYSIQLDAHTRHTGRRDYKNPEGGQFGVFLEGINIIGGLDLNENRSGGCWTNIADLSKTDKSKGGERNNGNQTLIITIPSTTTISFRGRTTATEQGGIKLRMRTIVYKLGEVNG